MNSGYLLGGQADLALPFDLLADTPSRPQVLALSPSFVAEFFPRTQLAPKYHH
jgi:hypothetical protein